MNILVDADACPVKDIIIDLAKSKDIPVILVSSLSHYSSKEHPDHVKTVYVEPGPDSADFKIVQLAKKQDIIVTQDYGLASLLLPKGCIVLHHKGFEYDASNIDSLLQTRHLSTMARKSGQRTKGPKPLSDSDREKFTALLQQHLEN